MTYTFEWFGYFTQNSGKKCSADSFGVVMCNPDIIKLFTAVALLIIPWSMMKKTNISFFQVFFGWENKSDYKLEDCLVNMNRKAIELMLFVKRFIIIFSTIQ